MIRYLGIIEGSKNNDSVDGTLHNHPPEVLDGVAQRVLGSYELHPVVVAIDVAGVDVVGVFFPFQLIQHHAIHVHCRGWGWGRWAGQGGGAGSEILNLRQPLLFSFSLGKLLLFLFLGRFADSLATSKE